MASPLSHKRAVESPTIPDRLYFKIGDVAKICGLETYVLRFWESQFPQLKPNKSGTGQRLYRRREVELVLEIKRLVQVEGYTLAGARQALDHQNRRTVPAAESKPELRPIQEARPEPRTEIRTELRSERIQEAPSGPALRLPATPDAAADRRRDIAAATIGHARAELREIAALLAVSTPRPPRRRPRLATLLTASDSLFPS